MARKSGQVTLQVVESVLDNLGGSFNPLEDSVYGIGQTTPAILSVPGLLEDASARSTFSLQADLSTKPLSSRQNAARQAALPGTSSTENVPAYVWLPLNVPADSVGLSFEFRLNGDGVADRVVAGLGASNLFNVKIDLLSTNTWLRSGLLPVSPWAGRASELFLGIAGGTSTKANLSVRNIRFIGLSRPVLETLQVDGRMVLTWAEAVPGLVLEFSPNLMLPDWSPISGATSYSGQRVYTNAVASKQGFYRLRGSASF